MRKKDRLSESNITPKTKGLFVSSLMSLIGLTTYLVRDTWLVGSGLFSKLIGELPLNEPTKSHTMWDLGRVRCKQTFSQLIPWSKEATKYYSMCPNSCQVSYYLIFIWGKCFIFSFILETTPTNQLENCNVWLCTSIYNSIHAAKGHETFQIRFVWTFSDIACSLV